jgi:hypothetical protein
VWFNKKIDDIMVDLEELRRIRDYTMYNWVMTDDGTDRNEFYDYELMELTLKYTKLSNELIKELNRHVSKIL